jgi:hypothetical protein
MGDGCSLARGTWLLTGVLWDRIDLLLSLCRNQNSLYVGVDLGCAVLAGARWRLGLG